LGVNCSENQSFVIKNQLLKEVAVITANFFEEEEDLGLLTEIEERGGVRTGVSSEIHVTGFWPRTRAAKLNNQEFIALTLPSKSWRNYQSADLNSKDLYDHLIRWRTL
jgi:hypothetical protein